MFPSSLIRVAMVLMVVGLIACSTGGEATTTTGSTTTSAGVDDSLRQTLDCDASPTAEELVDYQLPTASEAHDITLLQVSLAGYYYQAIDYGAHSAGEAAGVNVTTLAAEGYASPDLQLSQVEDAIEGGTDAIVIAPSDIQGSIPAVQLAIDAGLPVVNVSTEVAHPEVYMVMQDDYVLGQMLADRLAEVVPDGGTGILVAGPANATWSRKRTLGFSDRIAEAYPNIELAAAPTQLVDPAEGLASFEDAVQANPAIDWIASVHYFILQPAAIPSEYQGTVPYVSFGYEPDSITALEAGTLDSVFGIEPVSMGRMGIGHAISLLEGAQVPRITCLPAPVFTAESVGSPVALNELIP
ncbi:MAG TPA: sugar ABC transporter substrate-binding protein [Acidimicrobiia bacterium]|nr:sugar ABC transporter substrate-binding protein [Acidimicrobiia bacterium]